MSRSRVPGRCESAFTTVCLLAAEALAGAALWESGGLTGNRSGNQGVIGRAAVWGTEDLLAAAARLVGLLLVAWLVVTTLASLAHRVIPSLRRVGWLDSLTIPAIRRILDRTLVISFGVSALVGHGTAGATTAVGVAVRPAPAATPTTAPPPTGRAYVVVTPDGGFEIRSPAAGARRDAEAPSRQVHPAEAESRGDESIVIRAPMESPTDDDSSPTDAAPGTSRSRTSSPGGTPPALRDERRPDHSVGAAPAGRRSSRPSAPSGGADDLYTVRAGDSLWTIAERRAVESLHGAGAADISRYWALVVEANRSSLRSGNPSLIFPGEIVELPPLGGAGGRGA